MSATMHSWNYAPIGRPLTGLTGALWSIFTYGAFVTDFQLTVCNGFSAKLSNLNNEPGDGCANCQWTLLFPFENFGNGLFD